MYGWTRDKFDRKQAEKVDPICDGRLGTGACGILAGTRVATDIGWRPVEAVWPRGTWS
ncbi:hypothetical protein [Roseisalinus antarcticus]|uniref:Uncharacterized protein n=1 Tax=Roseisalinus antarcticus TaxID=254357 RepID=A0A1Y5TTV4_9RHOB|nr:hypothetical protein [Roseisalinus antarcticus]SLN70047.1 hypothetical protein ROA7023_03417 [Roseisalinus antarcticus]